MKNSHRPKKQWFAALWWTYSEVAWMGFFTGLPDGYRFILRYEMTWSRSVPELAALEIREFVRKKDMDLAAVFLQPEMFSKPGDTGEHVAETFRRNGVAVRRGTRNLEQAYSRIRSWLEPLPRPDGTKTPTLVIHPDCEYILHTMPSLEEDPTNREDILSNPDSYPVNALGLFLMGRPMPEVPSAPALPPGAIGHDVNELRSKLPSRRV